MLLSAGCEPASITDARNQLGRGPARIAEFQIPIADTSVTVAQFLCDSASATTPCDTTTMSNGLMGITFNPQTLNVPEGEQLKFGNVATFQFVDNVPQAVLATGPVTYSFDTTYTVLSVEPRLTAIDSVVADSGSLTFTTLNRMNVQLSYTLTLNGFKNNVGTVLSQSGTVSAASGNGPWTSHTIVFNLAGVTITPQTAGATLHLSFTIPAGGLANAATLKDSTIIQSGTGRIVARRLVGSLDPATTPELNVAVEEFQQIDSTEFDFGDMKDAVQQARLNDARMILTVRNTANAPITLTDFTLGAVKLVGGQVPKAGNAIVYQTDSLGAITVPLEDTAGTGRFHIARGQASKVDTLQVARLLDRIVDSALAGKPMAIVGSGTAVVGDGNSSTIRYLDSLGVNLNATVALDFTLPPTGITFSQRSVTDGAGLDPTDTFGQHVDTAAATAIVRNGTPFGVQVRIALVRADSSSPLLVNGDTLRSTVTADSLFKRTDRVELGPVTLAAAAVDAQGLVTAPVTDTASVGLTGAQSQVLLGDRVVAAIRLTLLPSGVNSRGAVRTTDKVFIHASGLVQLKSGGVP